MENAEVNLSSDLAAISTYNAMLNAVLAHEEIPRGYLIEDHAVAMGIRRELLLRPMKGLCLAGIASGDIRYPPEDLLRGCPISVAYEKRFNQDRLYGILDKELGLNCFFDRQSLFVCDPDDSQRLIGIYGRSRLQIHRTGVEKFLRLGFPSLTGINQDCFL